MQIDLTFAGIVSIIQLLGLPALGLIYNMAAKTYRANKLNHFKIDALVYAIQKEMSTNGFTKTYTQRLEELKSEHKFIDKGL